MNRRATLFLIASLLLIPAALRAGSTITVNSTADTIAIDDGLTLREALILAGWEEDAADGGNPGKTCFTSAERAQVAGDGAGCFTVASPVLLGCTYNPAVETRWVADNHCWGTWSGPGFGRNDTDQIVFAPAVDTIVTAGTLEVTRFDTLNGSRPGGGRVRLTYSGVPGQVSALRTRYWGHAVEPDQVKIQNLEIDGFSSDCIRAYGVRDSEFSNLLLHGCAGDGIRLTFENRNPSGNKIGGGTGFGNEIRQQGGYGIRIESSAALLSAPVLHRIQGNRIGWSTNDPGLSAGNAAGGIGIYDTPRIEIGGTSSAEANRIAGNGGPGVVLHGALASQVEIFGNYIGLIDPSGSWLAKANAAGVLLEAGASNCTVGGSSAARRNVIAGNAGHGIRLRDEADFNLLRGNRIGLDPGGSPMPNAGDGVRLEGPASQNQVLENLVSANAAVGIHISGVGADSNTIDLNVVGLDPSQSLDRGNSSHGVQIDGGAKSNKVGSGAGLGNHIAGNDNDGVHLQGTGTEGNQVFANLIGLDFNRFNAVPNSWGGVTILFGAKNNTIGAIGAGNTISGNGVVGVYLFGSGTSQNAIRGNRIGLSAGDGAIGNAEGGIRILSDADLNTVEANVVSGNGGPGIALWGPGLAGGPIVGNLVGRDAADLVDRPNAGPGIALYSGVLGAEIRDNVVRSNVGSGIYLSDPSTSGTLVSGNTVTNQTGDGITLDGASGNVIGSLLPFDPNDVRQNAGSAVRVVAGTGNPIRGNVLAEAPRAIELGVEPPPNDPLDADAGPNQGQNYPIPSNVVVESQYWQLTWGFMAAAETAYEVDVYVGDCDAQGRGLPRSRLVTMSVETDLRGRYRGIDYFLGLPPAATYLFLQATDPSGNSSEISPCLPLGDLGRILVDGFESGYVDGWSDWLGTL